MGWYLPSENRAHLPRDKPTQATGKTTHEAVAVGQARKPGCSRYTQILKNSMHCCNLVINFRFSVVSSQEQFGNRTLFILLLGMFWVDKEKLQFRIPWKHGSRQGWEQNKDAVLFQMWAEHTGTNAIAQLCRNASKHYNYVQFVFVCLYLLHRDIFVFIVGKFRRGDERSVRDPKTWKATFRCALNSLPDVQEVPNMSEKRGPNAYRVYQFLEPKKSRKARKSTGKFVNIQYIW